jgi:hypothetical protein
MLTQEEKEDNKEWEQRRLDGDHYTETLLYKLKKEREKANKSRRTEEERPIPLLEFLSKLCSSPSRSMPWARAMWSLILRPVPCYAFQGLPSGHLEAG